MAQRELRVIIRKKETTGNILPNDAFIAEPFVNTYEGRLFFSGTPGGIYEPVEGQNNVFEIGGNVGVLKALSGINLNDLFIATGITGQIITYEGVSDMSGYFLSGTSSGLTLAPISSITPDLSSIYVSKTGDTMTGTLILPEGTTTEASLIIQTGGTFLNTVQTGAFEFVGNSLYFTDLDGIRRNILLDASGATATTLNALSDTEVGGASNGNGFYYDGNTGFWRNTNIISIDDDNNIVTINNNLTANTISATTFYGNASGLTGIEQYWFSGTGENSIRTINCISEGDDSVADGYYTSALTNGSHSENIRTISNGIGSHAEGYETLANGSASHAEGYQNSSMGLASHAEGVLTISIGQSSHSEGYETIAIGNNSHSEGYITTAVTYGCHSEGGGTLASGDYAHAEGGLTKASGNYSHSEGESTLASGNKSHAEGWFTTASGHHSHTEGGYTTAGGYNAHAGGYQSLASGSYSYSMGYQSKSLGNISFTHGDNAKSFSYAEFAIGRYNYTGDSANATSWIDTDQLFVIGNGTGVGSENNALTVYKNGNSIFDGNLTATTFYSGNTDLYNIFQTKGTDLNKTYIQNGLNTYTGGTEDLPTINISSATLDNLSITALTSGRIIYVGTNGILKDKSGFEYNESTDTLLSKNLNTASDGSLFVGTGGAIIGSGGDPSIPGTGDLIVHGKLVVYGESISAHTTEMYIEDNNITMNYNPTADTSSTSLGAGWSIQDGAGISGEDVFFDIRGTGTTVNNRSFSTNLYDIRIRETGSTSNPSGVRVLAEWDELCGGEF
jgi:hypothetical protein